MTGQLGLASARSVALAAALAASTASLVGQEQAPSATASAPSERTPPALRAILIGCTSYSNPKIARLEGPANDVALLRQTLMARFPFREEDIVVLADGAAASSTRQNILAALVQLTKAIHPGDRVVFFYSGHGTQQPDRDFDPDRDLEPDGLDEVLLPQDAGAWDPAAGTIVNGIVDDELREHLTRLTSRGAKVWAIFDCCCSGTISRAWSDASQRVREVRPTDLTPVSALEESRGKARQRSGATRGRTDNDSDSFDMHHTAGSFVALYAAQPSEATVEMSFPREAAPADQVAHGLLTYVLCSILARKSSLTYLDLQDEINRQYDAWGLFTPKAIVEAEDGPQGILEARPSRDGVPSPQFIPRTRGSSLVVETRGDGSRWVNGGAIHGLTLGSVLTIRTPQTENAAVLGCVKIVGLQPLRSRVEPAAYGDYAAADPLTLMTGCRAEVAFLDFGAAKRKIGFWPDEASARAEKESIRALTLAAADSKAVFAIVELIDDADWAVRMLDGQAYLQRVGSGLGTKTNPDAPGLLGPAPPDANLADWIRESLERIVRAETLLSLASSFQPATGAVNAVDLRFEMLKFKDKDDKTGEVVSSPSAVFHEGDQVGFRLINRGAEAVDATLLFIDSGYGIHPFYPANGQVLDSVLGKGDTGFRRFKVNTDTVGVERMVLIAVKSKGAPVDFSWLSQPSLAAARAVVQGQRGIRGTSPLDGVFESLLYGEGGERGVRKRDMGSYFISSIAWTTEAPAP